MRHPRLCTSLLLATLLLLLSLTSRATTIDPLIWQQMVLHAEFVGIAECEIAGGIVARYKVVESWKGMPIGSRFTLRLATNYWGPQFPITLVGEKYLVTAYASAAPTRIMSTTFGNPVPLWWRNIPAEYSLPLWQGRVRLPLAATKDPLSPLGSQHADLNTFKQAIDELLSHSPEERERLLLLALVKKYLSARIDESAEAKDNVALQKLTAALHMIERSSSATQMVAELLKLGASDSENLKYSVSAVLSQGGGQATLKQLRSKTFKNTIWDDNYFKGILAEIEQRLAIGPDMKQTAAESNTEKPPTEQELAQLRKVLTSGTTTDRFGEAFEMLTRYDPAPVVDYLISWTNPQRGWQDTDYGYVIGSYFAWRCGKDREVHLQRLLNAQDPLIRVAGAVYLSLENPTIGKAKLEELSKLPGDAGVWAALNLARRGQKSAMPRLLDALAVAGQFGHMSGVPHENLQLRIIVLLSNSAAASSLPQPNPPAGPEDYNPEKIRNYQEALHRYYVAWWQTNESKIQLSDPWLKTLEQQKVD